MTIPADFDGEKRLNWVEHSKRSADQEDCGQFDVRGENKNILCLEIPLIHCVGGNKKKSKKNLHFF